MTDDGEMIEVLRGERPDGLTWCVLAGGTPGDLATFVDRELHGVRATSGFRGPALYSGQLVNSWTGRADGTPPFVMVRTAPEVHRVVALMATGRESAIALSEVVEEFTLRFGAMPLPTDDEFVDLRVETT